MSRWRASNCSPTWRRTFAPLVAFRTAALEGLTDEQYVRSVLRVVFNRDS